MQSTYTAFVNCRRTGTSKPFQPRKFTFSIPTQGRTHPLDIEIMAFKEARGQGFEVQHVVSFREQDGRARP